MKFEKFVEMDNSTGFIKRRLYSAVFVSMALAAMLLAATFSPTSSSKPRYTGPLQGSEPVLTGQAAVGQLKQNGTFDSLNDALIVARYSAAAENSGAFARNESNDLDLNFSDTGLVMNSTLPGGKWSSDWRLTSVGYGDRQIEAANGELKTLGNRIELVRSREGVTEWFENRPNGVEHGFTLDARLRSEPEAGALRLVMSLDGDLSAKADADGQGLTLLNESNELSLRYEGLKVWDSQGDVLTARMQTTGREIWFDIDDNNAIYPITIDPTFIQPQKVLAPSGVAGEEFGGAVAISGNTAIVGANAEASNGNGFGSAYVFIRNGTTWTFQQKLTASDASAFDAFGSSVAIDGNTVVVGAFADSTGAVTNHGSAYVFVRNGTIWTQQQKLTASDSAAFDVFGRTVAIAGDTVAVGSPSSNIGQNSDQGSAYIFARSGSTWSQQQKLTANDGAALDYFGDSVAISGSTVIVGATEDTTGSNVQQGSAYIFVRTEMTWNQQQKLTANDGAIYDFFGFSVAISGDSAVVGTLQNVGANFQQGSAYVFVRNGATWTQQQKLLASDGASNDSFGNSVAIAGNTIAVGASGDTIGANSKQGSAYIFARSGTAWTEQQKLVASDGAANDSFGASVAVSSDTVIAGALDDMVGANQFQGSAYFYTAGVTVSGKVTTPSGLGLRNATVVMTDSAGVRRTATTSSFGLYSFENVLTGENYVLGVSSKRYRFAAKSLLITTDLANIDFVGLE